MKKLVSLVCVAGVLSGLYAGDIVDKLKFKPDLRIGNCVPVTKKEIDVVRSKMKEGRVKITKPDLKWSEYIIIEIDDASGNVKSKTNMYEDYEDCGADLYEVITNNNGKVK